MNTWKILPDLIQGITGKNGYLLPPRLTLEYAADRRDFDQLLKIASSPSFVAVNLTQDPIAGNQATTKAYVDGQIASVSSTGIPKINSFPFSLGPSSVAQRQFTIPMDLFDSVTDTLMVYIGTAYTPPSDYVITNTVRDGGGTVTARGYFTLNNVNGVDAGTVVDIIILKNVPIGTDGSINGAALAVNSVPLDRVQNAFDKRGGLISGELAIDSTTASLLKLSHTSPGIEFQDNVSTESRTMMAAIGMGTVLGSYTGGKGDLNILTASYAPGNTNAINFLTADTDLGNYIKRMSISKTGVVTTTHNILDNGDGSMDTSSSNTGFTGSIITRNRQVGGTAGMFMSMSHTSLVGGHIVVGDPGSALDAYAQRLVIASFANTAPGTGLKGVVISLQGNSDGPQDFRITNGNVLASTILTVTKDGNLSIAGSLTVGGNQTVAGTKSALVQTETHGDQLLFSVESPENRFEDFYEGILDIDGNCIIEMSPIFLETVEIYGNDYHVYVQGNIRGTYGITQRNTTNFVVEGEPGAEVMCRVLAWRRGYKDLRFNLALNL
jgi:hypothetical protein